MKNLWLMFAVSIFVSGCQINRVEGEYRDVEVKVSNKKTEPNTGFCPPGQAKKGRC